MKFLLLIVAAIGAFAAAFIALVHISASPESTMPFLGSGGAKRSGSIGRLVRRP